MRAYSFLFVALLFVPLGAFAETYKIDTSHSRIAFRLHQFVSTVRGDFHRFSGTIEVDHKHPERHRSLPGFRSPASTPKFRSATIICSAPSFSMLQNFRRSPLRVAV